MPYIHFTDEQKFRANTVDLASYLEQRGEKLLRSGREKRLQSDHSITIRGSEWYDHASGHGGHAIDFLRMRYNLSFPEAVTELLGGEKGTIYAPAVRQEPEPRKPFLLPPAHTDMRRVYAYLMKQRLIERDILSVFVKAGLLYEDAAHHNAVFVGLDESGVPQHAHKRSTNTFGESFRMNVEGSNPAYSFHCDGPSKCLYVFEAPIDLLSYISLHPENWQAHSYVSLCGIAPRAMLCQLELRPELREVYLCLDHDPAGIENGLKLRDLLLQHGYESPVLLQPTYKDWNEDLKALHGMEAIPAQAHPQLEQVGAVFQRLRSRLDSQSAGECSLRSLQGLLDQAKHRQHAKQPIEPALEALCLRSLQAAEREYRQLEQPQSSAELLLQLHRGFRPFHSRAPSQISFDEMASLLSTAADNQRILTQAEKMNLAKVYEQLASSCVKGLVTSALEAQELELREPLREMQLCM